LLIRHASRMSPAVKLIVQKFVPFPAVGQLADIFYCISYFIVRNTHVYEQLIYVIQDLNVKYCFSSCQRFVESFGRTPSNPCKS